MAIVETQRKADGTAVGRIIGRARGVAVPLLAAAAAVAVSHLVPLLSALLIALALGAVLANAGHVDPARLAVVGEAARWLLRLGVVFLGLQLPVQDIAAIGARGVLVIAATVTLTYVGTRLIGHRLGLDQGIVALVAAGFSICGAAAIAAVSDVTRARQRDVALAVAMVTVFGGAMIALLPWAGHLLRLDEERTAVWAGASIHEVAQVAAAASLIGGSAVAVAMLVKLGRVACLAPLCWLVGRRQSEGERRRGPAVPWFIIGFAALSAVRSALSLPDLALDVGSAAATLLLAAGMFGLGLGLRLRELWPVPGRVLLLATFSTAIAAGGSLVMILLTY